MSITLNFFLELPFEDQVTWVWNEGYYVATRYKEEDTVGLYHMKGGFFVELYYDNTANHLVERARPFPGDDLGSLEVYTASVSLDGLKF